MALSECAARSFTAVSIQKNAPDCSGVYALSNSREWLFVGDADDIRARLMEHLAEAGASVAARRPTGFTFEICSPGKRDSRRAELVRELAPHSDRGTF
jgi:hypothetical protein